MFRVARFFNKLSATFSMASKIESVTFCPILTLQLEKSFLWSLLLPSFSRFRPHFLVVHTGIFFRFLGPGNKKSGTLFIFGELSRRVYSHFMSGGSGGEKKQRNETIFMRFFSFLATTWVGTYENT